MAYRDNRHFETIKLPITLSVLAVVAVLSVLAAIIFLGDRREIMTPEGYGGRVGFDAATKPVGTVIAKPVQAIGDGTNWIDDYLFAVRENSRLRQEVQELSQYRDKYVALKDLNSRYEKLLNLRTEPLVDMVTARSVTVSRGPFNNSRLIDAGSAKGIRFGYPVITEHGLIGRVVGTTDNVSRVIMVTDVVSHVPVMVMRNEARAMMNGDGGGYPRLEFIRGRDSIRKGDQIVTSGDSGIFPRGLPVGEALKGPDGIWRVKLYADRAPIDFVKVLMFKDFSQLPNAEEMLKTPSVTTILPPPPMPEDVVAAAIAGQNASTNTVSGSLARPARQPIPQSRPTTDQTNSVRELQPQTRTQAPTPSTGSSSSATSLPPAVGGPQ